MNSYVDNLVNIFNSQSGGFFIECGALDGETRSNTLVLEQELGWKGLLVEADLRNYDTLLTKHRKAWSVQACLSTVQYPNKVRDIAVKLAINIVDSVLAIWNSYNHSNK